MNRQQVIWLIVRAFGLYLLMQVFMVVPNLLADLYAARAYSNFVLSLSPSEEEFEIQPKHLISVCDAVLNGGIEAKYLRIVRFCVVGSDTFMYDTDTPEGDLVGETVLDWSAPEANYALTIENVRKFRERLITGRNPFAAEGAG